jgi:formylglycine-generating enzyme required for sulfatase activity
MWRGPLIAFGAFCLMSGELGHAQGISPGEPFRDCAICPEMVLLPPGWFTMGSPETEASRQRDEGPQHNVAMKGNVALGKFEVTHDEFLAFVTDTNRTMEPCFFDPIFPRNGRHPAICLTWHDAQDYVAWLSRKAGYQYRLPSEAEWEFAARARRVPGTYQRLEFGEDVEDICANANTSVKECDDGFANTAPVGSFPPNDFGIHDTIGNVWEFIEDCPTPNYEGAPADGSVWKGGDCSKRVIRGAGWINYLPDHLRVSNRGWLGPKMSDVMTGFRVARAIVE